MAGRDLGRMCYAWLALKQSHSSPPLDPFTAQLVRLPLQKKRGDMGWGRAGDRSSSPDLRKFIIASAKVSRVTAGGGR